MSAATGEDVIQAARAMVAAGDHMSASVLPEDRQVKIGLAMVIVALAEERDQLRTDLGEAVALLNLPQLLCEDDDKEVCGWLGGPRWPDAICWEHKRREFIARIAGQPGKVGTP